MSKRLVFVALTAGLAGMVAQLLLLREFLVVFHGNDLAIGIIFANWLAVEALGAFVIGKRLGRTRHRLGWFIVLAVLFALCAPMALYCVRIVREIIGVAPGVGIGVFSIFYSSLFILLLPSLLHGALFVFTCERCALFGGIENNSHKGASSIGRVYVVETLGHIVGAVLFTFLLIPFFQSFTIILAVSVLMLVDSVALATFQDRVWRVRSLSVLVVLVVGFVALLVFGGDRWLHAHTVARQWPHQRVVHHQHSFYGNVAVIEREGEYTFLVEGIPVLTAPTPDIVRTEEFVHLPMLAHARPENVAVLVGGAGGVLNEILKHPTVRRLDYTEIDPVLIDLVRTFSTPLTEAELGSPLVNTLHVDGRRFLQLTPHEYDVIFVGIAGPANLQVNRLFTAEFVALAKKRLREGGILVVSLPGSLTYIDRELRNLNGVIINTLKSVFPYLHVVPGYQNIFLASASHGVTNIDAARLYERRIERQLDLRLITRPHLEERLAVRWLDWFNESMHGATEEINRDFRPKGFFYNLAYWNAMFSPYLRNFFVWLEGLGMVFFVIVIVVGTLVLLVLGRKLSALNQMGVSYSVATTGFVGMTVDLLLIFAFQALFGFVFHWVGLLVAMFMAGVGGGGLVMTRFLPRVKNDRALLMRIEGAVGFFSLLLPVVILVLARSIDNPFVFALTPMLFLVLSLAAGMLVGLTFPLANKMYLARSSDVGGAVGHLYSADLLGGWFGGIIAAVVLLPVLGLVGTSLVLVMMKASSLLVLVGQRG